MKPLIVHLFLSLDVYVPSSNQIVDQYLIRTYHITIVHMYGISYLSSKVPMEDAERVQVLHAVSHVGGERDAQSLRHRRQRPAQDELFQRATFHVLRERMELTLMDTRPHKTEKKEQKISEINVKVRQ